MADRVYWAGCRVLLGVGRIFFYRRGRAFAEFAPETILLLRNGFFGDFVVAVPAIRALRSRLPQARIVLLTGTSFSSGWRQQDAIPGLFDIEPGLVDEVISYSFDDVKSASGRRELAKRVAALGATSPIVLDYSGAVLLSAVKRIALCWSLGLPFPGGLMQSPMLLAPRLLNQWRTSRPDIVSQYEAALRSVTAFLDITGVAEFARVDAPARGMSGASRCIGIAPFSKQRVKQWPLEKVNELVRQMLTRYPDYLFEIHGSRGEAQEAEKILSAVDGNGRVKNLCGTLTPAQLRARMELLDLVICADSGPMHVSSLVGTPVVALFAQITLHQFWKPWGGLNEVVSVDVPCAQCETLSGRCPRNTYECIEKIPVSAVLASVQRLLVPVSSLRNEPKKDNS